MSYKTWLWSVGLLGLAVWTGCGSADNGAPAANSQTATGDAKTADQIVLEFMAAVKTGNKAAADALITPIARQTIQKTSLDINPPSSPGLEYTVKAVQFIQTDQGMIAHVGCEYIDKSEPESEKQQVLWALRTTDEGWRIAGMALQVFPGEEPVLMNFEDQVDLEHKQQAIAAEITRRSDPNYVPPAANSAGTAKTAVAPAGTTNLAAPTNTTAPVGATPTGAAPVGAVPNALVPARQANQNTAPGVLK